MKIGEKGLQIIKDSEGLALKVYKCPAGKLTVGYGHTGVDVLPGMSINETAATVYLRMDVKTAEDAVSKFVKVPVNQNQFDALVSFTFNCGAGRLQKSNLLKLINENKFDEAAEEFLKYNHAAGKELPGLTIRRQKEKELFLTKVEM